MTCDVNCPHCGETQMDAHNGGDPREWWRDEYIHDGDCDVVCDHCGKSFVVRISWSPSFEGMTHEDAEL